MSFWSSIVISMWYTFSSIIVNWKGSIVRVNCICYFFFQITSIIRRVNLLLIKVEILKLSHKLAASGVLWMICMSGDKVNCSKCSSLAAADQIMREKMKERRFKIEPILPEEIVCERLPLIEYFAVTVQEKSKIEPLLQILPAMPSKANHLKRIKNGQILIQAANSPLSDEFLSILQTVAQNIFIRKVEVPACKPITRKQFLWAKQFWPTNFHPNKRYEALLNGNFFSIEEHQKIIEHYLESEKIGNGGPGCVIVDLKGEVVAKSGVRDIPLGHAAMMAISSLCEKHRIGKSDVLQYLGTGYDVYITDEPCAMCAMAFVHFRVSRVFYGKRTPKGGVYESCWRIQEEKSLNHHYQVFRIDELS